MSAARPPDPGRPLAYLIDGPYAGSVLYADELAANMRAAGRYPPGHPAADMARYVASPTSSEELLMDPDLDWTWRPLTAAELELRTSVTGREADLSSSAATGKAARDHDEWAAERAAERELRDAGHRVGEVTSW